MTIRKVHIAGYSPIVLVEFENGQHARFDLGKHIFIDAIPAEIDEATAREKAFTMVREARSTAESA